MEDDYGLWGGQSPEEAIRAMAFFTLENDLREAIMDRIEQMIKEVKEGGDN